MSINDGELELKEHFEKRQASTDEGATICVINDDIANLLIDKSNGSLTISRGRKLIAENGGKEDVEYDGRCVMIPTQKPLQSKLYIPIKYYISPVKLPYDIILGRKYLRLLGCQMALISDAEQSVYIHKREDVIYDIDKNSTVWEMMDYYGGRPSNLNNEYNVEINDNALERVNNFFK